MIEHQPPWLRKLAALREAGPPHVLIDRFFDATYDFPRTHDTPAIYLIASTPRSGSHYFGHLLFATKFLGAPLEYLSDANFRRWSQITKSDNPVLVLKEIMARRTSPSGWFGVQAHWYQLANLDRLKIPREMLNFRRIIWIRRRDLTAQAISLSIAMQTGAWTSFHEARREPKYDTQAISDCLDAIQQMEREWEKFIPRTGAPHLTLFYDDILANEALAVDRVLEWFGLPRVSAPSPALLRKQANKINTAWQRRFLGTSHHS